MSQTTVAQGLRKLSADDVVLSAEIEQLYEKSNRRERYLTERDHYKGTIELERVPEPGYEPDYMSVCLFWDVLRAEPHETALYLLLRHSLGYSIAEISAGLGVSYSRVKTQTAKARRSPARRG